ncbi:MAG: hypothetical protein KA746_05210 [Pyrinomonadaceae bacterium]|nr:hypothetical protein [Pyrinomonadaceae bacterium]
MNFIKMLLAVTLLVAAQDTSTSAQSPVSPGGVPKTDDFSFLLNAFEDKCVSGNCVNGKGKKAYSNGDNYEGDFVNGKHHGQGTYRTKEGQVYVGQFAKGNYSGRGKITFANGETYDGDWVNNERTGEGRATYKDGANYEGDWLANKWHGLGRSAYANGDVYYGNWVNGVREGKATYYFKDGSYYIGFWKSDRQHGEGRFFDKRSDQTITGIWKDGVAPYALAPKPNPTPTTATTAGQMTFEGGAKFDGPVAEAKPINSTTTKCMSGNCLNGLGKYLFANDLVYEGYFVNGKASGKGKAIYKDGGTYVGDFVNGKMEGRGIFLYANGNTYDGGWVNNLKSGQGTQTLKASGELYFGQFANDKRQGKGKATYKNGDAYDGDWVNGLREGQATYTFPNGSYYIGGFLKDKQHGTGKQFNKLTGITIEGIWQDGKFANSAATTKVTPADSGPKLPMDATATLLRETLNGKFDYLDRKPLTYILTNKKTNEVLRYQIEFIDDGGKLAFRWKESTKKEQSEKLVITDEAIRSASKYINFFVTKTAIAPDKEIAFILSQKLHKGVKNKEEISLDLGGGVTRLFYLMSLTASSGTYTDKNIKVLHYKANDGVTKVQILDDPICPLIIKIETAEYTLSLV